MRRPRPARSPAALGLAWPVAPVWLVALGTLAWTPGGFTRFVSAKLLVAAVAVLAATLVPQGVVRGRLPVPLVRVGGVALAVVALAALLGATPVASVVGRWPRYEGLPVLALYAAVAWAGARTATRRSLHAALATLAVVLGVFSALDLAGVSPLGPGGSADAVRDGSLLGNATDQGAVAMMAALVLAGALLDVVRRPARERPARLTTVGATLGLASALATVGVSGSRTAIGLTVVGLLALVALPARPGDGPERPRRVPLVGVGVAVAALTTLVVVALAVPVTRHRLLGTATGEARLHQWRLTWPLVRDHLALGLGPSRYVDAFPAHEDAAFVRFTGPDRLADSPHDVVLQVLVAGGLPLLVAVVVAVVLTVRAARRALHDHPRRRPLAVAVAAYAASLLVDFTIAGPTCLAALLLGALVALAPAPDGSTAAPTARRRVVASAATLAAVAGVAVAATACVADVQVQRGVDAADRHRVDAAVGAFDAAHRWTPWDADVRLLGAQALAQQASLGTPGAAPATVALAHAALARTPTSYDGRVALAVALLQQGKVPAALRVLDAAVASAPYRPAALVQRAIAHAGLGQDAAARADLRAAARTDPHSPVVRRLRSQLR